MESKLSALGVVGPLGSLETTDLKPAKAGSVCPIITLRLGISIQDKLALQTSLIDVEKLLSLVGVRDLETSQAPDVARGTKSRAEGPQLAKMPRGPGVPHVREPQCI